MNTVEKFLRKLDAAQRKNIMTAMRLIATNDLSTLDIAPLKGMRHSFRCRAGNVRILFHQREGENTIYDIGFRGSIYK